MSHSTHSVDQCCASVVLQKRKDKGIDDVFRNKQGLGTDYICAAFLAGVQAVHRQGLQHIASP